jgi:hypothetical protein
MAAIFYSHRLKTVLQHTVRELGLTVMLDDQRAEVSISENEAMIRETARIMGINVDFQQGDKGMVAIFYA